MADAKLYEKLRAKRQEVQSRPLTDEEAYALLNIRVAGVPQFSLGDVFSDEMRGIKGYRPMNNGEIYTLVHLTDADGQPRYDRQDLVHESGMSMVMTPEMAADIYKTSVPVWRHATAQQANLLYCDPHSRKL